MLYANLLVWKHMNIIFVRFTVNGINPWSQITPTFARVYHSDGGRTDLFSIEEDWTKKFCNIVEFRGKIIIYLEVYTFVLTYVCIS